MISQVMDMDKILEQTLLFDFYGELLTEHQKEVYEYFVIEDLSLGEIAAEMGISRQGVHDLIKRCNQTLKGYEEKLHLVEKFLAIREKVEKINELLDTYSDEDAEKLIGNIRKISGEIIEEL
ncbi:MAG: YlxM family DNA-binding protein [Dorea sp.]|nr:YlxM family DNA-binding protein [Dorea sp.]